MVISSQDTIKMLSPHMADYDRLGHQVDWRPYLMFFQQPNFVSPSVTTDRFGFRRTANLQGQPISLDDLGSEAANFLVGNSVAFGVGATSDSAAISSRLTQYTEEQWFNCSGRAFGAMQESILFQAYKHKVGSVRRVVLFTGLNDFYLYYAPKIFDEVFGIFFFSDVFYRGMKSAEKSLSGKRRILAAALKPFYGDRIDYADVSLQQLPLLLFQYWKKPPATEPDLLALIEQRKPQRDRILDQLGRTLEIWAALARGLEFKLTYVLQPILPWVGKRLSQEEQALLRAQDDAGGRWHRILAATLNTEQYEWYRKGVEALCARSDIQFVDLNPALRKDDAWLFLDRVHMNDAGQDIAARELGRILGYSRKESN